MTSDAATPATEATNPDATSARSRPIAVFLLLLVAVTIIPTIIFAVILLQRNNEAQQKVLSTLTTTAAASMSEAVDREITGMITMLHVLSTAPSILDNDLEPFHDRARAALVGTGTSLAVIDHDYRRVLSTRLPFHGPPQEVLDRDAVASAIENRAPVVTDIFLDPADDAWAFEVILPVFPADGPPLALALTRSAQSLAEVLSRRTLADGWSAALVDGKNTVVASTAGLAATGKPFFLDLISHGPSPSGEIIARDNGERFEAIVQGSELSGWNIVMWAPVWAVEQPLRKALRSLTLGGLIMVALGIGAALLLTQQITRPVRRLARDARRLGAGEMVAAVKHPIAEFATVSSALARAAQRRKEAENEIRFLMREVAHRSKNQLTVVASIAKQTARNSRSIEAFQDSFQKRLHGLARSTDLLIAGGVAGVELRELLAAQIGPFRPDEPDRLQMAGPEFRLGNQAAQMLGMALHELATNAAKYGAFSQPAGRLSVTWKVEGDALVVSWRETVQRLRRRPERRGFGTEVIERMLGGALGATAEPALHRDGMEWRFTIPLARLGQSEPAPRQADA